MSMEFIPLSNVKMPTIVGILHIYYQDKYIIWELKSMNYLYKG